MFSPYFCFNTHIFTWNKKPLGNVLKQFEKMRRSSFSPPTHESASILQVPFVQLWMVSKFGISWTSRDDFQVNQGVSFPVCWLRFHGTPPYFSEVLITLPKFNIAPEKWWLEDYFPLGKVNFQGRTVKLREVLPPISYGTRQRIAFFVRIYKQASISGRKVSPQLMPPQDKRRSTIGLMANHLLLYRLPSLKLTVRFSPENRPKKIDPISERLTSSSPINFQV